MPIRGLSELRRLPLLGKIRLGEKAGSGDKSYPRATDHFVVPPEVAAVHGDKPRELDIMFPLDDEALVAAQWLRYYTASQGLVCVGDAQMARAKIDLATGGLADRSTAAWEWREDLPCNPQECPEYRGGRCRRVMNLQFLLPQVPGLGVWQIDTSSFYSIVNVNSMLALIRSLCGRIAYIPLTLCLGTVTVSPPGVKAKTVHVLQLRQDVKLADLLQEAQKPLPRMLRTPDPAVEEPPDDMAVPAVIEMPGTQTQPDPATAAAGGGQGADSDSPGTPMDAWDEVKELIKDLQPGEERVKAWWRQAYDLAVTSSDFRSSKPPQKFGAAMIVAFRDKLRETREASKQPGLL